MRVADYIIWVRQLNMFMAEMVLYPSFHHSHSWTLSFDGHIVNLSGKVLNREKAIKASTGIKFPIEKDNPASYDVFETQYPNYLESKVGIDGIVINIEIVTDKANSNLPSSYFCKRDYPEYNALLNFCWTTLYGKNAKYNLFLEDIFCYFDWGAPIIRNGNVLKIFGRLSLHDKKSLEITLSELNGQSEPVIDMRNFEFMGGLLLPIFLNFSKKNPRTIWLMNDSAISFLGEYIETSMICYF